MGLVTVCESTPAPALDNVSGQGLARSLNWSRPTAPQAVQAQSWSSVSLMTAWLSCTRWWPTVIGSPGVARATAGVKAQAAGADGAAVSAGIGLVGRPA